MPATQFQIPFSLENAREGITLVAENDAEIAAQIELLRKSISEKTAAQYTNPQDYADFVIAEILGFNIGNPSTALYLQSDYSSSQGKKLSETIPPEIRELTTHLVTTIVRRVEEEKEIDEDDTLFQLYIHLRHRAAICYESGIGVPANQSKADAWFDIAAKAGHPQAQYVVAQKYKTSDKAMYFGLLDIASESGFPPAIFEAGICHAEAIGTEQNPEKAFTCFSIASDYKIKGAKTRFAKCYDSGFGVDQDRKKAFELFEDAAREGDADAMMHLSYCNYIGSGISERNPKEALLWFSRGIKNVGKRIDGFDFVIEPLPTISKDEALEIIRNFASNLAIVRPLFSDPEAKFLKSLLANPELSFHDLLEIQREVIKITEELKKSDHFGAESHLANSSLVFLTQKLIPTAKSFLSPLTVKDGVLEGASLEILFSKDASKAFILIPYDEADSAVTKLGIKPKALGLTASVMDSKIAQFEELSKRVAATLGVSEYEFKTDTAPDVDGVIRTNFLQISFPVSQIAAKPGAVISPSDAAAALSGKAHGGAGGGR